MRAHEVVGEGAPLEFGEGRHVGGRRWLGEALFEFGGGLFKDTGPMVDEDDEEGVGEEDVLAAGLEFLRANAAVDHGLRGAVGGL